MPITTGVPAAQLQLCLQALRVGAVQLQLAVVAQLPRTPPFAAQTKPYSTYWLPRSVNKWLKKQQRGQDIYPATALQLGTVTALRHIPPHISRPHYAVTTPSSAGSGPGLSKQPEIQSNEASRSAMRAAGRLAAQALKLAGSMAVPGTTTDDIDLAVHEFLINHGAYPSPLMYHGFPKSVCTSVNEVVCHGIPDSRPLQEGEIVNVDVTAYLNGFHGDTNATFCVGQVSDAALELVEVTRSSLQAAIDVCGPGVPFRAVGEAISKVADAAGMFVIRDFVGHGIGKQFHAAPAVLHYRNMRPGCMRPWQTFTIEPQLALGTWKQHTLGLDPTGWTAVTADGSLTAQFEHTVMITEGSVEVLTLLPP